MVDDFYCPECSYVHDKEDMCPFCNVRLVKLDEGLDEFSVSPDGLENEMENDEEFGPEELSRAA